MNTLAGLPLDMNRKNAAPLPPAEISELQQLLADWEVHTVNSIPQLSRSYRFGDFAAALQFTNRVGDMAEAADHHPALLTEWGKVTVTWWTHSVRGLHLNDFIMAARCDALYTNTGQA